MVVHPAFWQVVSRAALGPEAYFLSWSKLGGSWFLDGCGKNTSMICHNLLRIRSAYSKLFQNAALIGKAVKEGTAKLGLTLSGKSTLLANDKSLGNSIFGHLGDEGRSGDPNRGRTKAMFSQPMETNMERQTEGQESLPSMQDQLRGAKTHDDRHTICSSLWQGVSTAQVNAMCKNLTMGTVMGKTQACAISTVAWFFGEKRVPQIATRVEQISEWITMWSGFNVDTRRRIRKVSTLAKDHRRWNQATGPISATICSVLEAGWKPSTPGFWQAPEASAALDGALLNKAQIIDSFSKDMEMQTWKRAAGHSLSTGMEKGIVTDFAKKARSQLIKEGNFMAARALDFLVCGAINFICLRMDLFPTNFSVFVATRRIVGMSRKPTDQSHTHERIRRPCDTCAGILGHRSSFVCSWSFAAIGGENVGKQRFQSVCQ